MICEKCGFPQGGYGDGRVCICEATPILAHCPTCLRAWEVPEEVIALQSMVRGQPLGMLNIIIAAWAGSDPIWKAWGEKALRDYAEIIRSSPEVPK